MVSLAKVLLTISTSLSIKWFCEATVNQVSQTTDCLNNPFAEYLSQFGVSESDTLHLKGFAFNEISAKQFSDTFSELQHLTLDGCGINHELISILTLPSGLKSIRLERSNLTSKEIQSILDKLSPSLESLELIDCLVSELFPRKSLINSTPQKESLDLSRFSHLRTISINNLGDNFDSFNLLLSLPMLPLETIKLSCVSLTKEEWTELLRNWTAVVKERKEMNEVTFFNSLKEFDLKIIESDDNFFTPLVKFLFLFPHLENISLDFSYTIWKVSLPLIPSNIKQLSSIRFEVFMEDGTTSFWNPEKLSQLTHLSVYDSFEVFPYSIFGLEQLKYLKIFNWIDGDISLATDQCCSKLQHLSIQSKYLIPLLPNFKSNFPAIETLEIRDAKSENLNLHLKTIISSETLKCLQIEYSGNKKSTLKIEEELKSSIEEMKLEIVYWEFVSDLLEVDRFPCLKKLHIVIDNWDYNTIVNLEDALKKLSLFPQLASLTLKGPFLLPNEELSFRFENLKFFCFESFLGEFDLDLLLNCMPNLIELQLKGRDLRRLELQNSISIRYLELPYECFRYNGDFINVIKNTPNLFQLTTKDDSNYQIKSIPYTSELAYYFKVLKEYFQNELQFEIHPNSFPIKLLKNDVKLEKLVCLKSLELPNYLNEILPIDTSEAFVKQFFTIEIEKYFNVESIDYGLVKRFFNLISELKVNSKEDFSFVRKLLLEGKNACFTESTDFSLDNYYKLFFNHLIKSIQGNLKSVHLEFIEEFLKANKNYGPFTIINFLKSFFNSISVEDNESKIINDEIFYLFTKPLLTSSFSLLVDKIKENDTDSFSLLFSRIEGSEEEKKSLRLKLESIAEELKKLTLGQYEELCTRFKEILIEVCDGSFVESLFTVLRGILIPEMKCIICLDSLFNEKCKFFRANNCNCHLFHRDCLNRWLNKNGTCPQCRRTNSQFE